MDKWKSIMDKFVSRDIHPRRAFAPSAKIIYLWIYECTLSGLGYSTQQSQTCHQLTAEHDWATVQHLHLLLAIDSIEKWLWFLSHCMPFVCHAYISCASSVIPLAMRKQKPDRKWKMKKNKMRPICGTSMLCHCCVNDVTLCGLFEQYIRWLHRLHDICEEKKEKKRHLRWRQKMRNERINENVTFLYSDT